MKAEFPENWLMTVVSGKTWLMAAEVSGENWLVTAVS